MSLSNYSNTSNNKICSNVENDSYFYVFEIKISSISDSISDSISEDIFRKISYNKEGELLEIDNNIKKIKITMCKINNINQIVTIRKNFSSIITEPTIICRNNLIITLNNIDGKIKIQYIIL